MISEVGSSQYNLPEKCLDCPVLQITTAALNAFEHSTGGPGDYLKLVEQECVGYDIAPEDASNSPQPLSVEQVSGAVFKRPLTSQIARCAMNRT